MSERPMNERESLNECPRERQRENLCIACVGSVDHTYTSLFSASIRDSKGWIQNRYERPPLNKCEQARARPATPCEPLGEPRVNNFIGDDLGLWVDTVVDCLCLPRSPLECKHSRRHREGRFFGVGNVGTESEASGL